METNLILLTDSYKLAHQQPNVYPSNAVNLHSYGEARVPVGQDIVFMGIQAFIIRYLSKPVTKAMLTEAVQLSTSHGVPVNEALWQKVIDKYEGFMPIRICALPEGTVSKGSTPLWYVELTVDDPELVSLPSFIETALQRAIWYPSTIATKDFELYRYLKQCYMAASDNPDLLGFSYHDFGARGVSSEESAMIGGSAHLVYFEGSDNLSAIRYIRQYYNGNGASAMPAYSVPATEHSIQCSFGASAIEQKIYIINTLRELGKSGGLVSIVSDGFNFWRELDTICSDDVISTVRELGVKLVVRPDSGDPVEMLPEIFSKLEAAYGYTLNSKGFKVLNGVGVIWGDGIDHTLAAYLFSRVLFLGYAPENLVLGSGGALLQKVNRDTFKFAQKTSAIKLNTGEWVGVAKDPVTDKGKRSKKGRQESLNMVCYYENYPAVHRFSSFSEIRYRARGL